MGKYGKYRTLVRLALAIWLTASPAIAECRLALLLALDVSSSVDRIEDRLQRQGLADALSSKDVIDAVLPTPGQTVALSVFEWSGRNQQVTVLPWRILARSEDVLAAAAEIRTSRRSHSEYPTAIGYDLGFAAMEFENAPACHHKTLDVSGDGINNEGFEPRLAYRHFRFSGVTVNGLTIGGRRDDLAGYYRRELIRGAGAFVEEALGFRDFERAMRRKLVRELQSMVIGEASGQRSEGRPGHG